MTHFAYSQITDISVVNKICCMHRSTFTQHLDSLPSNSMIFVFYSLQCCHYNGLTTFSFLEAERGIDGSWDEF